MNSIEIDLHDKIEQEAVAEVQCALFDWEMGDVFYDTITIITGNGYVLKDAVIELLEENNYNWNFKPNNPGAIIIYKK